MEVTQECTRYIFFVYFQRVFLSANRYILVSHLFCSQGGSTQLRFQPRVGKYLAASSANVVSVLDVETQACRHSLQV